MTYPRGLEETLKSGTIQPFGLALTKGRYPGSFEIDKFGYNPATATTTDPEDIWEYGGLYNFSATSDISKLSSSSTSDTGKLISVTGILSPNTVGFTTGYALLNGQNKVSIYSNPALTGDPISFWRVHRMKNESAAGLNFVGTIYCYVDDTITGGVPNTASKVRAVIINGNNQTQMAIMTTPKGYVAFLYRREAGMQFDGGFPAGTSYARICYKTREYGKVFQLKKTMTLNSDGTSIYQDLLTFPHPIPSLTDVMMCIQEVSDTIGIWGTFDFLFIPESEFSDEYLQEINQPGY